MENLKKEDVCLDVSTRGKHKKVIELLQKYKEDIYKNSLIYQEVDGFIAIDEDKEWFRGLVKHGTLITPKELEEILKKERGIEPAESIETLTEDFKSKVKKLGFKVDVVFEEIDPRIGMFGKFWDDNSDNIHRYDVLEMINDGMKYPFYSSCGVMYKNFQTLTQSEIAELTKNNPK